MLKAFLSAALTVTLLPGTAMAEGLYTEAELAHTRDRATGNIITVFQEDIIGNLPRADRPRAAAVTVRFPEHGPSPLSFYANPATNTIYMPLESIRFFDDVATLFAWVESKGCDPASVQAYLWAKLRDGQPLPAPLKAFHIDRDTAFADPFTYDVSGKILSSGIQFILAHELGHLMLGHQGGMAGADSQAQEIAADSFALDHFSRLGGLPMGVFWYYMAAWWQDPVGSEARDASTHPVSPERISLLAERLTSDPMAFSHGELDPEREAGLAAQIGGMVANLAVLIDDDGMLSLMPIVLERDWPASRLATACPTE